MPKRWERSRFELFDGGAEDAGKEGVEEVDEFGGGTIVYGKGESRVAAGSNSEESRRKTDTSAPRNR
jgi:hypothetical protein